MNSITIQLPYEIYINIANQKGLIKLQHDLSDKGLVSAVIFGKPVMSDELIYSFITIETDFQDIIGVDAEEMVIKCVPKDDKYVKGMAISVKDSLNIWEKLVNYLEGNRNTDG